MKILIVDDETELNALLVRWLKQRGHEASGLTGGADLLAWVSRRKYDAVILDLLLPDANGLSLIPLLRKPHPKRGSLSSAAFVIRM